MPASTTTTAAVVQRGCCDFSLYPAAARRMKNNGVMKKTAAHTHRLFVQAAKKRRSLQERINAVNMLFNQRLWRLLEDVVCALEHNAGFGPLQYGTGSLLGDHDVLFGDRVDEIVSERRSSRSALLDVVGEMDPCDLDHLDVSREQYTKLAPEVQALCEQWDDEKPETSGYYIPGYKAVERIIKMANELDAVEKSDDEDENENETKKDGDNENDDGADE